MSNVSVKVVLTNGVISGVIVPAVSGFEMSQPAAESLCAGIKSHSSFAPVDGVMYAKPTTQPVTTKPRKSGNKSGLTVKVNWQSDSDAVLKWVNSIELPHGTTVEVRGDWVWLHGPKPTAETRKALKDAGFWFSNKRKEWYHKCGGKKIRVGKGYNWEANDSKVKYGSRVVLSV